MPSVSHLDLCHTRAIARNVQTLSSWVQSPQFQWYSKKKTQNTKIGIKRRCFSIVGVRLWNNAFIDFKNVKFAFGFQKDASQSYIWTLQMRIISIVEELKLRRRKAYISILLLSKPFQSLHKLMTLTVDLNTTKILQRTSTFIMHNFDAIDKYEN